MFSDEEEDRFGYSSENRPRYVRWTSQTSGLIHVEPKFECPVWLTHKNYQLPVESRGVISFEARSPHDIGISLHCKPTRVLGGDRGYSGGGGGGSTAQLTDEKPAYEIALGCYLNMRTEIRRFGVVQRSITRDQNPQALIPSASKFHKYWIGIDHDLIVLGRGRSEVLDPQDVLLYFRDREPIGVNYIGLMTWDVPVQYRSIHVGTLQHPLRYLVQEHEEGKQKSRQCPSSLISYLPDSGHDDASFADWRHPAFPDLPLHRAVLACVCPFLLDPDSFTEQPPCDRDAFLELLTYVYSSDSPEVVADAVLAELWHVASWAELLAWKDKVEAEDAAAPRRRSLDIDSSPSAAGDVWPQQQQQQQQMSRSPGAPGFVPALASSSSDSTVERTRRRSASCSSSVSHRPRSGSLDGPSQLDFDLDAYLNNEPSAVALPPASYRRRRNLFAPLWQHMQRDASSDNLTFDFDDDNDDDECSSSSSSCSSSDNKRARSVDGCPPTDVEFCLEDGSRVLAHKIVVALKSPVFRAMLSSGMRESLGRSTVNIMDVDPDVFRDVLQACYTGFWAAPRNIDHCLAILIAADRFSIVPPLSEYVKSTLTPENCCFVLYIIDYFGLASSRAYSLCVGFAKKNFSAVCATRGWLKYLPFNVLIDIIRSDDILVITERTVFEAVCNWLVADFPRRQSHVQEVLGFVRFRLIDREYLRRLADTSAVLLSHPSLRDYVARKVRKLDELGQKLVGDAASLTSLAAPAAVVHVQDLELSGLCAASRRARSIKGRNLVECLFSHAGDRNGVLHYLGTGMKKGATWINPLKRSLVDVKVSCASSRYCQRSAFVGTDFHSTSFITGHPPWLLVDLGHRCALILTYYTIQHDGSDNYLRNWELQGSEDSITWLGLRQHVDDREISQPGQFAGWSIEANLSSQGFRYLRIIQDTGAGSRMSICRIEFYGFLKVTPLEQ